MDIRTKLVFALVAVALVSMFALGSIMYWYTNRQLEQNRLEQLEGLAESLKEGLVQIASGWEDRVSLIASRTQLREILRENNMVGSSEAKRRVRRILADALASVPTVETLAVYDAEGRFVGSAGWGTESDIPEELTELPNPEDGIAYQGVLSPEDEDFRIGYAAPLLIEGPDGTELVGALLVRIHPDALVRLTRNRAGLGATGKILIAIRDHQDRIRVFDHRGPDLAPRWKEWEIQGRSDPVTRAMENEEGAHSRDMVDPEGDPLWAAVRFLPELGWGLVVQIDAEEGRYPAIRYRERLTDVAISLAALAILAGTILGLRFAKPIQELAGAADRIRDGDLSVRAPVASQDEIGLLARSFNQMAEELEQRLTLLREFQNYFDYSLDMLCIAGYDGYFKRVNPAFERILGWSEEELLQRRFLDFVHPDDLEKTEAEIERLAHGMPTISFENRYVCVDGSEKILSWRAHPEPETGMIYAIARDVTERRAEQRHAREEIGDLQNRLTEAEAKLRGEP